MRKAIFHSLFFLVRIRGYALFKSKIINILNPLKRSNVLLIKKIEGFSPLTCLTHRNRHEIVNNRFFGHEQYRDFFKIGGITNPFLVQKFSIFFFKFVNSMLDKSYNGPYGFSAIVSIAWFLFSWDGNLQTLKKKKKTKKLRFYNFINFVVIPVRL